MDEVDRLAWLEREVTRLSAKDAIRDCIQRYSRGVDRIDEAVMRSVFHPDATIDFRPSFMGPVDEWIALAVRHQTSQHQAHHMFGNIAIEVEGDRAVAESYGLARHKNNIDGRWTDLIIALRTFDRFSLRGGEWRIDRRKQVTDWARSRPITDGSDLLYEDGLLEKGSRNRSDPSYELIL